MTHTRDGDVIAGPAAEKWVRGSKAENLQDDYKRRSSDWAVRLTARSPRGRVICSPLVMDLEGTSEKSES